MDLDVLRDRRVLIAAGAGGLLLLAGVGIGVGLIVHGGRHAAPLASASSGAQASLQVEMGSSDSGLDLQRPLRCFVGGQFVGMLSLAQCAQRNGVEAGSLDVGLDTSGEVAAASDAQALQPLPGAPAPPQSSAAASAEGAGQSSGELASSGPPAACWQYGGDWRKLSDAMSLDQCVQALFAGKCVRPGAADYGRWGSDTLRLVTGKVERGGDTGGFRTLVKQPPGECTIPHLTE